MRILVPLRSKYVQGPYSASQLNKLLSLKIIPGHCKVLIDLASLGSMSVYVKAESLQPFLSQSECLSRGRAFLHEIQGQQMAPRAPEPPRPPLQPHQHVPNGLPPPPTLVHCRQTHDDNCTHRSGACNASSLSSCKEATMQDSLLQNGATRHQKLRDSNPAVNQTLHKTVVAVCGASGSDLPSWRGRNGAWNGVLLCLLNSMVCLPFGLLLKLLGTSEARNLVLADCFSCICGFSFEAESSLAFVQTLKW
jgi:hypothetical protein